MGESKTPVYVTVADIAAYFGVSDKTVHSWRARYGPGRDAAAIAKAPTCPQPDIHVGVQRPLAAWRVERLREWDDWKESLPGPGAGGGRPRTRNS